MKIEGLNIFNAGENNSYACKMRNILGFQILLKSQDCKNSLSQKVKIFNTILTFYNNIYYLALKT